jgi:two-component system chemotaxis sensor kinase CheA
MTLPVEKIVELQLMLDMTDDGDSVGISLLAEVLTELVSLAKGEAEEDTLRELAQSSNAPDFLKRVRRFVAEKLVGDSVIVEEAVVFEPSHSTFKLPLDKIQELQLLLDMTHEGDAIGYQLLAEQFKELLSIEQSGPAASVLETLSRAADEPSYLGRVRAFLAEVSATSGALTDQAQDDSLNAAQQVDGEDFPEEGTITDLLDDSPVGGENIEFQADEEPPPFVDLFPQDFLDNLIKGMVQPPSATVDPEEAVVEQLLHGSSFKESVIEESQGDDSGVINKATLEGEAADEGLEEDENLLEDLGDIAPEYLIEGDLDILQEFGTECEEHIGAIEQVILEAEGQYEKSAIDTIFRGIHSIKGGSAYFNLQEMKKCSHLLEDMLHEVRDGHRPMDSRLEQLCLFYLDCQKDALKRYREASASGTPVKRSDDSLRLLRMIRSFDKGGEIQRELTPSGTVSKNAVVNQQVEFKQAEIPQTETQNVEVVEVSATEELKSQQDPKTSVDAGSEPVRSAVPRPKKPEVIVEPSKPKGVFPSAAPRSSANRKQQPQPPPPQIAEQKRGAQLAKKIASEAAEASKKFVKVDTERLDNLIDLIGEMVVFSSVLVRFCKLHMSDHKDVMDAAHRVEKFSKELQDVGISMRLDPIRGLFQKMQRLVWDTSKRLGKDIVFQMEGEDTELDRNLIDRLADPLMHMVRNSLDHGIEPNDEREAEGKPRKGTIKLSAYHSGGNVHIKIQDDGRGLDPAKLIAKAVDKGIIEDGKRMSNDEAFQLIFAPGFSTAAQVTDLSGRGVGMDVVRRNVEDLRGRIHIQSTVGEGAAFIIELPLTLAIIEGIQISVGVENFIIPSLSIVEFLRPRRGMISRAMDSAETFFFRGKYLPLFRMSEVYSIENAIEDPERASIVVLEENGDQFAFLVDTIEGECSTVIKSLGEVFEDVKGVSGGAIMPQGNVVLILDVKSLVRLAQDTYSHVERVKDLHSTQEPPIVIH